MSPVEPSQTDPAEKKTVFESAQAAGFPTLAPASRPIAPAAALVAAAHAAGARRHYKHAASRDVILRIVQAVEKL